MATLRELMYSIETNTSGLNKAFPALDKLASNLERLDKTIQSFGSSASSGFGKAGDAFEKQAKDVDQSAKKIKAALDRQQAATVSAQQKLISLNKAISSSGGDTKLITANTRAYQQLEDALKRTDITAGEVTLAKAKYNATLSQTKRALLEFSSAQKASDQAVRSSESAMLKQSNALERMRIRYEDLKAAMESQGAGPKTLGSLDASFGSFEKSMKSGVLNAGQFSDSVNKVNKEFAGLKRSGGFAKGMSAGLSELASSTQLAVGPLSGLASRMTALKTLASATSITIAATVGVVVALGAALAASVVIGAKYEMQMARVNAILKATGNIALVTGSQVDKIVRNIADSTGAAQSDVREAAAGFLTIRGMNKDLLEESLLTAQGLAVLGNSTIQDAYRNFAQSLQDPMGSLNSLNQYGIAFNETEKRQIELLDAAGNKHGLIAAMLKKTAVAREIAISGVDTLTVSWGMLLKSLSSAAQDFAVATGILTFLRQEIVDITTDIKNLTAEIKRTSEGFGYFASIFGLMEDSTGSLKGRFIELYEAMESSDASGKALDALKDRLRGLQEAIRTDPASVNFEDIDKALAALASGNITKAINALDKYSQAENMAATAAKEHENAVIDAGNTYEKLAKQYSSIIQEQEKAQALLKPFQNDTSSSAVQPYDLMKEALMKAGKSAEQAEAQIRRLRTEVELGSNSVAKYVNEAQKSNISAQMDIAISKAVGAEKRRLQLEQRTLNELWSSGVITSADYQQALKDLATLGFSPLGEAIAKATKEAEAADYAKGIADLNKELDNQIALAKVAADVVTKSAYAQAEALAVAAQMQDLLNRGVEQGSEEWNNLINKTKELTATQFAGKWIKDLKDVEDELRIAQIAMEASAGSALEEASAVAMAKEQIKMLNDGIKEGSVLWNQRLAAAQALVQIDFNKQHIQAVKSAEGELAAQQRTLETLFYSEATRKRMIAISEKEYELAQKYGSLQDARAQKELQLTMILQDRDNILNQLKQVADVVDNAMQNLEDSVVDFLKTGEFNFKKFANAILEDVFRMTFKMVITDPLKDMIGKGLSSLTGGDGGILPSAKEVLQVGTLANPAYTYLLNDLGAPGGLSDLLGGDKAGGLGKSIAGIGEKFSKSLGSKSSELFGGKSTQDLLRKGLDPLTKASSEASSGIVDLGNGLTMTGDAFTRKMELAAEEAAKIGDYASKSFSQVGDSVNQLSSQVDGLRGSISPMTGSGSPWAAMADADVGTKAFTKTMNLSGKEILDLKKTVQSEVVNFKSQGLFDDQGHGVIDTILNRKASGKWGDSITDVVNSPSQFSAISGNKNSVGDVANLPMPNDRVNKMVDDYLVKRAEGLQSSVGGDLNYLNPAHSGKNGLPGGWGGPAFQNEALRKGQVFGAPGAQHFHGTAAGMSPVDPNYGLNLPQGYGLDQMTTNGIPTSPFAQLPQQMQMPGMPNPMGGMPSPTMGGMGAGGVPAFSGGSSPFGSGGAGSFTGGSPMGGLGGGGIGSDIGASMGGMGGDITGQLRGSLDSLSQTVSQTSGSFTSLTDSLPEVTTNLTSGLDKAAESASNLADDGLQKASSGMNRLATDTITQSVTAQAQSAVSTQQMGTSSITTSASVQMLGQAAMTAAAQMQGGAAMGAVGGLFHTGGIVGSETGGGFRAVSSFAGAPRLHGGLHSDEFKAILKRGEGVFTEDQMEALGNAVNKRGEPQDGGDGMGSFRRGGGNVTVNLNGVKDFDSFRKSQAQLNAGVSSAMRQSSQKQD